MHAGTQPDADTEAHESRNSRLVFSAARGGTADAILHGMKKPHARMPLDPLGVKTGLELAAGGIIALLLMRWLGM